ncbi:MAG: hypothetical protein SGI88_14675 [Candidatus Hydrogenedentes bacterium]|nr:hypothetical protein [Candidatus Hydrogenedentota bacterium]
MSVKVGSEPKILPFEVVTMVFFSILTVMFYFLAYHVWIVPTPFRLIFVLMYLLVWGHIGAMAGRHGHRGIFCVLGGTLSCFVGGIIFGAIASRQMEYVGVAAAENLFGLVWLIILLALAPLIGAGTGSWVWVMWLRYCEKRENRQFRNAIN